MHVNKTGSKIFRRHASVRDYKHLIDVKQSKNTLKLRLFSREEITVDEKVEKALVAVGDESALREDASDEESDEDSELDDEDEVGKKKRQLCEFNWNIDDVLFSEKT